MSKKKTLIKMGYKKKKKKKEEFVVVEKPVGGKERLDDERELVEVWKDGGKVKNVYFSERGGKTEVTTKATKASVQKRKKKKPEVTMMELFFCQYCDKFFEKSRGRDVHESRWCKEKK